MHVISSFETRTTLLHCVLQSVPLSTKTNVFSLLTSAKFDPVIVTGIPSSPAMRDEASLLTLMIFGGGANRMVHLVLLVQAEHVTVENMGLQSKADSHPFFGSSSLLNFPLSHAVMVMQVEASEQAVHMVLTTAVIAVQSKDDSHPLVRSASLSYFPSVQVKAVHVEDDEQEVQVPSATEGHPASHPLLA